MTDPLFLVAAIVAVLVAIGFVAGPLLIGRRQTRGPLLAVFLAVLIPAATWFTYQIVGTPEGINPEPGNAQNIRAVLADLAGRVAREPDNHEHWARLGMAYKDLEEFGSAEHAFRRALYVDGDSDFLRVELAETLLYASQRRRMPEEGRRLLREAVENNPHNQKGMWLLGIDAFQVGDFAQAAQWFEKLKSVLPANSAVRATVDEYLARARQHGAGAPPDASDDEAAASPEGAMPTLDVAIRIDEALRPDLTGDETVFIIVRAAEGSRVPLAVRRVSAADLPARFELDERHAMIDADQLARAGEIVVTARVSRSGNARARPGDLEGQSATVRVSERIETEVSIDRVL